MRWSCSRCGEEHEGLPLDWAHGKPAFWEGPRADGDFLGDDLCSWTDDDGARCFFARGVLHIPVHETGEVLGYGIWSSLSERSYDRLVARWDDDDRELEPPYFGFLANALPGYPDTLGLHLAVITRSVELRPGLVLIGGEEHPLIQEQRQGIDRARVQAIAELNLH